MAATSIDKEHYKKKARRGGKVTPALCDCLGFLLIILVILLLLPSTVLKYMGYEVFEVVSESMEPALPVNSMVLVKPCDWKEVEAGDIIAYRGGDTVVVHRVVQNRVVEGEFITKGDANEQQDIAPVPYSALAGKVVWHLPILGGMLSILTSMIGKIYLGLLLLCGLLLNILGRRLRAMREY